MCSSIEMLQLTRVIAIVSVICISAVPQPRESDLDGCDFKRLDMREPDALSQFQAIRKVQPVVLTNTIDDWKAFDAWTWKSLQERIGHMKLTSEDIHPGVLGDMWMENVSLASSMSLVAHNPRLILIKPQSQVMKELSKDFYVPKVVDAVQRYGPQFSIGGKGQAAYFNDHQENWLAQVFGRKLWMVVAPSVWGVPAYADFAHPCHYKEQEERLNESARFLKSCVIHPGEIILLPEKWPHSTCNLDDYTVGVGYFGAIDQLTSAERHAVLGNLEELSTSIQHSETEALDRLLDVAAEVGHSAITQRLLVSRANVASVDARGRSPIHSSAKMGWAGTTELLLAARADALVEDKAGDIPLLEASYGGHLSVVQVLCNCSGKNLSDIAKGCLASGRCGDAVVKKKTKESPLASAAAGGHLQIIDFFLREGSEHKVAHTVDIDSPLARGSRHGHIAVVEDLLMRKAGIDTIAWEGRSPLSWASRFGHRSVIEKLVKFGANVTLLSDDGKTTVIEALKRRQNNGVVELLLQHGASANQQDSLGRAPLHYAANIGKDAAVQALLAARAAVGVKDSRGRTPIVEAALLDQGAIVEMLLESAGPLSGALANSALDFLNASLSPSLGSAANSEVRAILEAFTMNCNSP